MSSNQTLSFLLRRFAQAGIRPKTRHGQNFLIDLNLVRLIVETAQLDRQDVVLEVGTGTGALTALMAARAAAVVTVEIDPQMQQLAGEELLDFDNVTLLKHDALRNKNTFDRRVLDAIASKLEATSAARFKLAANLPFSVATPVISNLLLTPITPVTMTVTIQRELADRMMAKPGTKDYGALSVWIQSQCDAALVRLLPPSVFWPRPKVTSAIMHLEVVPSRRAAIADLPFFHRFVRAVFLHRRKFLRSVVQSAFKDQLEKDAVDQVLSSEGFDATNRAEQLDIAAQLRLCEALRQRVIGSAPVESKLG